MTASAHSDGHRTRPDTSTRFVEVLRAAPAAALRVFRGLHWYLKEVMGENAYIHYLESYRRRHGTEEGAMGAREFWKDLTDEQDRNPRARCC